MDRRMNELRRLAAAGDHDAFLAYGETLRRQGLSSSVIVASALADASAVRAAELAAAGVPPEPPTHQPLLTVYVAVRDGVYTSSLVLGAYLSMPAAWEAVRSSIQEFCLNEYRQEGAPAFWGQFVNLARESAGNADAIADLAGAVSGVLSQDTGWDVAAVQLRP